jgi:MoaA/NifB/PqqE/SkfB family radical SAM enzyme
MSDKQSIYCALALGSASINSAGQYIPCCNIRMDKWEYVDNYDLNPKERINAQNLINIRQELREGIWPKACVNCELAEKAGSQSMRNIWNYELDNYVLPIEDTIDNLNIRYLDLTFETKCNSKCMTCSPNLSTFWDDEWKHIYVDHNLTPRNFISQSQVEKLLIDFPNVVRVSFVGGEPTISEHHLYYLKRLIELDRSKDITISYVTNMTGISDELLDLWKHFKSVHVAMSMDGHDKYNEYIRYPFKWSKIESQMRKLMELFQYERENNTYRFSLALSCTVSLLNFNHIPDFLQKVYSISSEYGVQDNMGYFLNRVSFPDFMQLGMMPKSLRQSCKTKSLELLKKYENAHNKGFKDSLNLLIAMSDEADVLNVDRFKKLKHFISSSDNYRHRNIKDYIPEVSEFLYGN